MGRLDIGEREWKTERMRLGDGQNNISLFAPELVNFNGYLLINTRVILMKESVKIKLQFSQDGRSARNLGDRLDEFVSERGHLAVRFEPTVCGELLPKGLRSVGHEEETQRCHTNFVALADIGSQTGQNGMNFFGDGEDDALE